MGHRGEATRKACVLQQTSAPDAIHRCEDYGHRGWTTHWQDGLHRLAICAAQHAADAWIHWWYRRADVQAWLDKHAPWSARCMEALGVHQWRALCGRQKTAEVVF